MPNVISFDCAVIFLCVPTDLSSPLQLGRHEGYLNFSTVVIFISLEHHTVSQPPDLGNVQCTFSIKGGFKCPKTWATYFFFSKMGPTSLA